MSSSATEDLASSQPHPGPGHLAAGKSETGEIGLGVGLSPSGCHSGLRISPTGGVRERPDCFRLFSIYGTSGNREMPRICVYLCPRRLRRCQVREEEVVFWQYLFTMW